MTRGQALAEARRRWGPTGKVQRNRQGTRFSVGHCPNGGFLILGAGASWEDAFAQADGKAAA